MGFQTPQYALSKYLEWTSDGTIQLPDFQRGYKWEDERIRSLLVTILRGHPLGVVMLLKTGNDQIRFKPRPLEGATNASGVVPDYLLLDGQQRLTSLTQALTGAGVVATMDGRGKLMERRYYVDMRTALLGDDRLEDAVISVPGDGVVRSNFGRDIHLDLSTPEKEREEGYFPLRLLYAMEATNWLFGFADREVAEQFMNHVFSPARAYTIPAISLDEWTSKAAVATVFEKVNTGGLALNVFELLTATFAGDKVYYDEHGTDFRLNEDWRETQHQFSPYPALANLESTDFLQAVTLLTTREGNLAHTGAGRPPAVSAKREDVLKLELQDYLDWVGPLREAFIWASGFLADQYIFDTRFLPYPKQLVPLAAIKVVLGQDADLISVKERIDTWFWCGILGELYGGAIETRFVRDLEQVPPWARAVAAASTPNTVVDATFVESRLHSLRTRGAAAYKGVYALTLHSGARDWMYGQALDKVQYSTLAVDVHHIFPRAWCDKNGVDDEHRESIVNKTAISAKTNRAIGGAAPSAYTQVIEKKAGVQSAQLDALLEGHLIPAGALRADDFDTFFLERRERLCRLIEDAMGKQVPRDASAGAAQESSAEFESTMASEAPDEEG